jgi:hypothetical protein
MMIDELRWAAHRAPGPPLASRQWGALCYTGANE